MENLDKTIMYFLIVIILFIISAAIYSDFLNYKRDIEFAKAGLVQTVVGDKVVWVKKE